MQRQFTLVNFSKNLSKFCNNLGRGSTLSKASRSKLRVQKSLSKYYYYCSYDQNSSPVGITKSRAFATKSCQNISSSVGITKSRTFATKCCQNISTSVGITKSRAFAAKCCQNISSSVGFTKSRAFAAKCCQNCANLLCRNIISRASPENNFYLLYLIVYLLKFFLIDYFTTNT